MSNDESMRAAVRAGADQIDTLLSHFSQPDATFADLGKSEYYLEVARLHVLEVLRCLESELRDQAAFEPIDFGS